MLRTGLQTPSGKDYEGGMNFCADVSDDGKIGVEELVYVLKLLAN